MNGEKKRVIIVGAGASGIAAATRLYEKGIHDLLVLEAENRIGGRVYTLDINDDDEGYLELGAQWIHGEVKNVVFETASARALYLRSKLTMDSNLMFAKSSGEILGKEMGDRLRNILNFNIRDDFAGTELFHYQNCADFFMAKFTEVMNKDENKDIPPPLREEFIEYFHQCLNSYDGSDNWFESAVSNLTDYRECEGCHYGVWSKGGYRTLFSILMEKCQELSHGAFVEQNIITGIEVNKISLDSSGVRVECSDGRTFIADHVIVTVSLGVLKERYEELFDSVPLPEEKIQAIKCLKLGTVDKIYLKFPNQWWPDDMNCLCLLWSQTDRERYVKEGLSWVTDVFALSRVEHPPGVLCAWVCGVSARLMEQIDEKEVQETLTRVLKEFFGTRYKIPDPVSCFRSTWWSNKHFRGSYSYRTPESDQLSVSASHLCTPITNEEGIPVVLFAGEATHSYFFSTVHAAVESGWREANRIISLTK